MQNKKFNKLIKDHKNGKTPIGHLMSVKSKDDLKKLNKKLSTK